MEDDDYDQLNDDTFGCDAADIQSAGVQFIWLTFIIFIINYYMYFLFIILYRYISVSYFNDYMYFLFIILYIYISVSYLLIICVFYLYVVLSYFPLSDSLM
jgi:hypothetical protein